MRPKLILHVGMHKTGSTTLQNLMEKQRKALKDQGVWYARTDRPPAEHLPKHNSLAKALVSDDDLFAEEKRILLDEFAASGCCTLLLSEEGLSVPSARTPQARKRIAGLAADFDVETICFVRRQDRWVESLWTQRCREGVNDRHITEFVNVPRIQRHMNYLPVLEGWARIGKLTVLGYEQASARGLVASFAEAAGIRLSGEGHDNPGTSFEAAAMMAALRREGISDFEWSEIERSPLAGRRSTALGARLRGELLTHHAKDNASLERRYGVVFPTDLPEEPAEPLPEPDAEMVAAAARQLEVMRAEGSRRLPALVSTIGRNLTRSLRPR